ncbi:MAG TPA: SRPBCC domain-containing protein [Brachybacterium massiliense]|uniref:SRPBCC domain-containing protein n=1 Tax=Brachybacterium massiliense TaxID=1755098 RepID=A0A921SX20_9MICO|nr:SRPBCC domain-containing protein [Brachybacterium massiliense]
MTVTESPSAVDAVRRALEIHEHTSSDGHRQVRATLTLTTHVDCAPAQLWPLLTAPAELPRWFGTVTGELREGGSFEVPGGARGRVLEIESPHRLSLAWDRGTGEDPLLIQLDPEDDGTTQLRLRHTALVDAEEFERTGPGALALDWEVALLALAAHTDGWRSSCLAAVPVPTPRWRRSNEAAAFLRAWSVRWAAEAIAAGVDEATARRGEAETTRMHLAP